MDTNSVYKGDLEKLQQEYLARKKMEDEKESKRKAILEGRQEMAQRQAEKDKLAKEVKELRWKQSKTGQAVGAVKDVAQRSWLITKNIGHGLSVAGGAVMQGLEGSAKMNAQNRQNRRMASRQTMPSAVAPSFDFESFENQIVGGGFGQPMQSSQNNVPRNNISYKIVKAKIRVKRGRKWVTKNVIRHKRVYPRVPRIRRIPRAPTQKPFDVNDILKGMPQ